MPYGQGGGDCFLVQKNIRIIQAGLNSGNPKVGKAGLVLFFITTRRRHIGMHDIIRITLEKPVNKRFSPVMLIL